ncbi:MAG: cytochrome B [Bacteroidia bacterium]|nr:cytochrome B [Bacteroidia bacterium]
MYGIILVIHSLLRWAILILLLACIIKSLTGMISKRAFTASDNKISLFLMISAHTQLLVAILLYFISPFVQFGAEAMKDPEKRFFTMEHTTMMLLAIILITMGRILGKKAASDKGKFRRLFWFNIIALLIIFMAIPWPFAQISRPWF